MRGILAGFVGFLGLEGFYQECRDGGDGDSGEVGDKIQGVVGAAEAHGPLCPFVKPGEKRHAYGYQQYQGPSGHFSPPVFADIPYEGGGQRRHHEGMHQLVGTGKQWHMHVTNGVRGEREPKYGGKHKARNPIEAQMSDHCPKVIM